MTPAKLLFVLGTALGTAALAQSRTPAFDVASVKPYRNGGNESSIGRDGARITLNHVSLRDCIMFAYSIPSGREYELTGPGWMDTERFDIEATAPADTSREQVREMLQSLLAERFSLKTHRESKRVNAYELITAKDGARLKATESDDGAFTFRDGRVIVRAFSMDAFADRLSGPAFRLDRPVLNRTGMQGAFDFTLEWAPLGQSEPGPSLFTALQEQLGLKLDARQTEVRILVVDRVDRIPTAN
jgi:uncharacterized protein (TIGR03435 family)